MTAVLAEPVFTHPTLINPSSIDAASVDAATHRARARRGVGVQARLTPRAAHPSPTLWVHVPKPSSSVEVATVLALQGAAPLLVRADVPAPAQATSYEWTPRGLVVLLALVAGLFIAMTATVVSAYLGVSNEPPAAAPVAAAAYAAAPAVGGR